MPDPAQECMVISSPAQRRMLASPLRMEILEQFAVAIALQPRGKRKAPTAGASIAEIARRMGRRPDSLYHHVRLLAKSGLLIPAGTRKAGKRDEALHRPVAQTIAMPCDPRKESSVRSTVATVAAMFRLAEREMRSGLVSGEAVPAGPLRTFFTRRLPAHLTPKALTKINRHLDAIAAITERELLACAASPAACADATPVSITLALLPMAARQRVAPASRRERRPHADDS